jgi:hypothetical protein
LASLKAENGRLDVVRSSEMAEYEMRMACCNWEELRDMQQ